jgi:hypothetical protein
VSDRTCSISGCDRPVAARGWCSAHYCRWRNHGDPLGGSTFRRPKRKPGKCSVPDCGREFRTAGLCSTHYQRMLATGTTDKIIRLCPVADCGKQVFSKGFCRIHKARWEEFGDPLKVRECSIEGCSRPAASTTRAWCVLHYTRWHKHGDVGEATSRFFQPPHEAADGYHWCITCRAELPLVDFSRDKTTADGCARVCRDCMRDLRTAQYYGISAATYRSLLEQQGGACRICRKVETATHQSGTLRRLSVDHDHRCCPGKKSCGKCVRGLLCARCNSAIGLFDEDRDILLAAIDYLGLPPAPVAVPKPRGRKKQATPPGQLDLWGEEAA